jgi:hypothetical protein
MYKKRIEITLLAQREAYKMWDLKVGYTCMSFFGSGISHTSNLNGTKTMCLKRFQIFFKFGQLFKCIFVHSTYSPVYVKFCSVYANICKMHPAYLRKGISFFQYLHLHCANAQKNHHKFHSFSVDGKLISVYSRYTHNCIPCILSIH